jgi:hypothetical protein
VARTASTTVTQRDIRGSAGDAPSRSTVVTIKILESTIKQRRGSGEKGSQVNRDRRWRALIPRKAHDP